MTSEGVLGDNFSSRSDQFATPPGGQVNMIVKGCSELGKYPFDLHAIVHEFYQTIEVQNTRTGLSLQKYLLYCRIY